MTFHLASSNPLIITTAAEAQRACTYAALVVAMVRNKKKILHPTSILCRQKDNSRTNFCLRKLKVCESKTLKTSDSSSQMCVCVC